MKNLFSQLFFKRKRDPLWESYIYHFQTKIAPKTPIRTIRFIAIDTETTGLNYKKDKILSIGAIAIQNYRIDVADSWECFIQQTYAPSEKEIAVHGIRLQHTSKGIKEKTALEQWLNFCKNGVLVAHHAAFDVGILNQALKRNFGAKMKNKSVDTAQLAIRLEHGKSLAPIQSKNYSLDALCQRYNIPPKHRHTASGDAFMTALLFVKLLARLEAKGIKKIGDL